jgi:hypothetical protein
MKSYRCNSAIILNRNFKLIPRWDKRNNVQGIMSKKKIILQRNKSARINVMMTPHLIFMTLGVFMYGTEPSLEGQ